MSICNPLLEIRNIKFFFTYVCFVSFQFTEPPESLAKLYKFCFECDGSGSGSVSAWIRIGGGGGGAAPCGGSPEAGPPRPGRR